MHAGSCKSNRNWSRSESDGHNADETESGSRAVIRSVRCGYKGWIMVSDFYYQGFYSWPLIPENYYLGHRQEARLTGRLFVEDKESTWSIKVEQVDRHALSLLSISNVDLGSPIRLANTRYFYYDVIILLQRQSTAKNEMLGIATGVLRITVSSQQRNHSALVNVTVVGRPIAIGRRRRDSMSRSHWNWRRRSRAIRRYRCVLRSARGGGTWTNLSGK